jgi:Nucleotidyl transferase
MKPVRKAVFPVAGLGTRFLPTTKAMPKEMLPVVDRPLIQWVVDEAREAGIEHFVFVTGRNKHIIEDLDSGDSLCTDRTQRLLVPGEATLQNPSLENRPVGRLMRRPTIMRAYLHLCSTSVSDALLGFCLRRGRGLGRQLQHNRILAFRQAGQQDNLSVRELQRVVMSRHALFVDLPENCRSVIEFFAAPTQQTSQSIRDRFGKCQFGPRQNANRNSSIFLGSKPTRAGTKVARGQLIANLCRP